MYNSQLNDKPVSDKRDCSFTSVEIFITFGAGFLALTPLQRRLNVLKGMWGGGVGCSTSTLSSTTNSPLLTGLDLVAEVLCACLMFQTSLDEQKFDIEPGTT